MKGDFSRQTFNPKKHYSRVLMQQGRVQLDADWNEQQAIDLYRDETTSLDVIGKCGAPMDDAGFGITTDGKTLFISQGRMYVDGILCENEQDALDYMDQVNFDLPYRARGQTTTPTVIDLLNVAKMNAALVYLDVWQRHLTALDDNLMREKALGGPDTTTRTKTVWQVRVLPLSQQGKFADKIDQLKLELGAIEKKIAELSLSKAKGAAAQIKALQAKATQIKKEILALEEEARKQGLTLTCDGTYPEWDKLTAPSTGMLNAQTQPPKKDEPCTIPPSAGYSRLENQLYRVEIHNGGTLGQDAVTFKWSRDNGTVVTSIQALSGAQITVHDVGPDAVLGFATGQWVELSDDWLELNGEPGELIKIKDVDSAMRIITLESAPMLPIDMTQDASGRFIRHPKLRRWDQDAVSGTSNGVVASTSWIDLEGGIQVQFSTGTYKTGDYWVIPARTATGEIEWPPFDVPNKNPIAQNAFGIDHHYCRLALIQLNKGALEFVADCRDLFPPLTKVCGGLTAIHVTGTNWKNDDWFSTDQLQKEGLRIFFDTLPDLLSLTGAAMKDSSATVIVSLELPTAQAINSPDVIAILDGTITLGTNYAQWMPSVSGNNSLAALMRLQSFVRAHVTLKGSCIWAKSANKLIYLDGQALGQPGLQSDNKTPRIDLVFPSGGCARASDFESWFYVQTVSVFQITDVKFMGASGKLVNTVQGAPNASVQLAPKDEVNAIDVTFNRNVDPKSVTLQSILLRGEKTDLKYELVANANVVQLRLGQPLAESGKYQLTVVGDAAAGTNKLVVKAADDGSAVDGNYDNQPGGNFGLSIVVG